jgi:hypothetical protein
MRRIVPAEYRQMPWRNGGGTTTEILVAPAEGRFIQRVSIADVASDGPFSRFDGYERHIMLLGGEGMTLDCGVHGTIDLRTPLEPRTFSGDWDVVGTLVSGPVRDFNVIVDRAQATAALEVRALADAETLACPPGTTCIVHVIDGALEEAAAGETLVAEGDALSLRPRGAALVAIARVVLAATPATAARSGG